MKRGIIPILFIYLLCSYSVRTSAQTLQPISPAQTIHINESHLHNTPVPILMYHSIGNDPHNELVIQPQKFRDQLKYLQEAGYTPIHFSDLLAWKNGTYLPSKPIMITLDDGYEDNFLEGYPILKQLGMKATIFIVTDVLNQPNRLTWNQIKIMQESGLAQFGAHTRHHVDLEKSPLNVQRDEIVGSKNLLEQKLGTAVQSFAYPSGRYSLATVEEVKKAGFVFGLTTRPGWAKPQQGYWTLHRVRINGSLSLKQFKNIFP